jgi:uncharacterized membrane protein YfcA
MIALVAVLAFAIEAAIGFGATVFAATLGAYVVPLAQLIPAFVPVNLALSAILAVRGRRVIAWRFLLLELAPPVAAGLVLGLALPGARLQPVFACFVIALALLQLVRPHRLPRAARIAFLFLGGVAHGLFGTGGPLVVYATRGRLADRSAFRATLAVLWLSLNIALVASFHYSWDIARTSLWIALALPVGLVLGERWHRRLPERVVWIVLAAAGLLLLVR